ncbi:MAG: TM0106 family RecB-like putative nuclease [Elainellaceae cyanobacterium]
MRPEVASVPLRVSAAQHQSEHTAAAAPSVRSPHSDEFSSALTQSFHLFITDERLLNYQRCSRRAFLDTFGHVNQQDPPSDYLQKLHRDSSKHQRAVIAEYGAITPHYPHHNWDAGAKATLAIMQQGVDAISHGVLLRQRPDGVTLVSRPKLLIKQPGWSYFGNWVYLPADIKLGKRPKADYQVVAAFHAYVLAEMQGAWTETSWLILRQGNVYEVSLLDQLPKMQDILDDCIHMMRDQREPAVFIARNRCDLCHWFSHCYGVAQQEQHLSLLPGVTPSRYQHLHGLNLTTVAALATTSPAQLETLPGFGAQVAHRLVRQAQATHYQKALPTFDAPHRAALPPRLDDWLPTAPVELYFDIEAAPERELIYLHGVLVVDRRTGQDTFHPLLAASPEEERAIWEQFLALAHTYADAPIFHFCPYEVQTVKKLARLYDVSDEAIQPLVDRFVDLHDCVVSTATLPIESYALKSIARWLGFEWRDSGANGAQSIYWYDQWLVTGDRTFLDTILRYNEDDCRATWHVKDWLVAFLQEHYPQTVQEF